MTRTNVRRPAYVEEIGRHLRDLPWKQRQELLDDVAGHLDGSNLPPEALAEWVERLGPARDYAQQLREGLGLETSPQAMQRARRRGVRRSRPRTKVLVGVLLALAVLTIGGLLWLSRVQPISFGDRVTQFGGETISAGGRDEHRWTWTEGEQLAAGTWMRNDGPLPLRVVAITLPDVQVPWDRWRVTLASDEDSTSTDDEVDFRPFDLDSGERQLVWFRGDFYQCPPHHAPGTSAGVSQVEVTFEILGVTRVETIDLGFTYSVQVPETGC